MAKKPTTTPDTTEVIGGAIETGTSARTTSKKDRLISMLRRDGGTTTTAISSALGWQSHTTRAAITGLRKSGHEVETVKSADGTSSLIYRIALRSDANAKGTSSVEASQ